MEPEDIAEPTNAELLDRIVSLENTLRVLGTQVAAQKILASSPSGTIVYTISDGEVE